jgi:hypothetical protein
MAFPRTASSDFAEIQSVLVRQKLVVDVRDKDALRECYTEDIELSTSFDGSVPTVTTGVDAVVAEIVAGWEQTDSGASEARALSRTC